MTTAFNRSAAEDRTASSGARRSLSPLSAVLLALALLAAGGPSPAAGADHSAKEPRAVEVLRAADEALRGARSLEYEVDFVGLGPMSARYEASVALVRGGSGAPWPFRAEIAVSEPMLGAAHLPRRFAAGADEERVWYLDPGSGILEVGSRERGATFLAGMPWFFATLPPLVRPTGLDVELDQSEALSHLGTDTVDGVACDVVEVRFPEGQPAGEQLFYVARSDRIPRRVVMVGPGPGFPRPSFFDFRLSGVRVDSGIRAADLGPPSPEGVRVVDVDERDVSEGAVSPGWTLRTAAGEAVSLAHLRGEVVVLDFWASWCPVCRSTMPQAQALHEDTQGEPVRVFGVNIFETGDPLAVMREEGLTYELLLEGGGVHRLYKLPGQPAAIVLGPDGTILHRSVGAPDGREEAIRAAVREGLAAVRQP